MKKYLIDLWNDFHYMECCEECMEVVAVYFNCPACEAKMAETDMTDDRILLYTTLGYEFSCGNCDTTFKIVDVDGDIATLEVK